MFRVGQKVVCVDAEGSPSLVKNKIYTISHIRSKAHSHWRGQFGFWIGLFLHETNPRFSGGFAPQRFRPVVERKTDISVFTEMLKHAPANADLSSEFTSAIGGTQSSVHGDAA